MNEWEAGIDTLDGQRIKGDTTARVSLHGAIIARVHAPPYNIKMNDEEHAQSEALKLAQYIVGLHNSQLKPQMCGKPMAWWTDSDGNPLRCNLGTGHEGLCSNKNPVGTFYDDDPSKHSAPA